MTQRSVRNTALDLLSRREHSSKELSNKLILRGFDEVEIEPVLNKLELDNLLNDERFAESYLNMRVRKGFGPIRIKHELGEKGISADITQLVMEDHQGIWFKLMQQQREKKFGQEIPPDYKEKMKQARFLQNRGFSPEAVMRLFR